MNTNLETDFKLATETALKLMTFQQKNFFFRFLNKNLKTDLKIVSETVLKLEKKIYTFFTYLNTILTTNLEIVFETALNIMFFQKKKILHFI